MGHILNALEPWEYEIIDELMPDDDEDSDEYDENLGEI